MKIGLIDVDGHNFPEPHTDADTRLDCIIGGNNGDAESDRGLSGR